MKVKNISFTGVYAVEASNQQPSANGGKKVVSGNDTKKLFDLLNPFGDNKKIIFARQGDVMNCINLSKPALVLVDDEFGNDASAYINSNNKYLRKFARLNKKTEFYLNKMLTKNERNIAKSRAADSKLSTVRDEMLFIIQNKLNAAEKVKMENFYNSLISKVKIITPANFKKLQTEILKPFKAMVSKI